MNRMNPIPPAQLGYRFPAEWEPHAATWLSWPHNRKTWPGKFTPIPAVWARLARTLARFEPVHVLAGGQEVLEQAREMVGGVANVVLHDIPTNDAWTRDHGPMFLVGPPGTSKAIVDWEYNSYGGKYPPFDADNAVPGRIAELRGVPRFRPGIVLEGGAVDGNGRGTILTSARCVLNPNRNPGLTRLQMERHLADYCGASRVIWLGGGIAGDDTDGHIDQLARFVGPRTLVTALEAGPGRRELSESPADELRAAQEDDRSGRPSAGGRSACPCRGRSITTKRLPASYCNFYIANGVVVVPSSTIRPIATACRSSPSFCQIGKSIGLPAIDLVWGLGAFHCITQQEPAG